MAKEKKGRAAEENENVADQGAMEVEDIFEEENVPPSNWFKFEEVGDRIAGELVEIADREPKGVFGASRVFTLKTKDGGIWNVSIPLAKTYVIGRAARAALGDTLGFEFKKEVPSATKGFAPAKSLEVYLVKKTGDSFDSM